MRRNRFPQLRQGERGQDQAIATALAPHVATIQALAAADALRAFGQKTDGRLPTTIVGLPTALGPLLSSLMQAAPQTPSTH